MRSFREACERLLTGFSKASHGSHGVVGARIGRPPESPESNPCRMARIGFPESARIEFQWPVEVGVHRGELAEELLEQLGALVRSGACCDEHTADQMVVFMALANGASSLLAPARCSSLHLPTAIQLASTLSGATFRVSEAGGGCQLIVCEGAGVGAEGGDRGVAAAEATASLSPPVTSPPSPPLPPAPDYALPQREKRRAPRRP